MLYCDDDRYQLVRDIKVGHTQLDPCLAELRSLIAQHYGVQLVSIIYDHIDIGPAEGRPRLDLIFEYHTDREPLQKNQFSYLCQVETTITKLFAQAIDTHRAHDCYTTDDLHLISDLFAEEAKRRAITACLKQHDTSLCTQYGLWRIDAISATPVVFYFTEADKTAAAESGATEALRQAIRLQATPHDEFHYLTRDTIAIHPDTKENVDANYEGSLFYYFR